MIRFRVTEVTRRKSSEAPSFKHTYTNLGEKDDPGGGKKKHSERQAYAEWEEVSFIVEEEDYPTVSIGNVSGNAFLVNQPCKLLINNPDLFGTVKIGDTIPFLPVNEEPEGEIVVPKLN